MVKVKPPLFGAAQNVAKALEGNTGAVKPQLVLLAFKRSQLLERPPFTERGPETASVKTEAGLAMMAAHHAQLRGREATSQSCVDTEETKKERYVPNIILTFHQKSYFIF